QVIPVDTQVRVPISTGIDPVLVPLLITARLDEELHLHLLEFTGAEDEIARGNLITETLADLRDTERRLLAGGHHHILEVDEDALRGFRPQVAQPLLRFHRPEVGLEHHVELARLGVLTAGATVRARYFGQVLFQHVLAGAFGVLLGELVGPESLVAALALDQRVVKGLHMPGGDPYLARQDHRGVQADDVVPAGDHGAPPLAFDVLLEFDAQWAVVPGRAGSAVDLPTREYEATALAQADDGLDAIRGHWGTPGVSHGQVRPH